MVSRKSQGPTQDRGGSKPSSPELAFWLEYASLPACEIAVQLGYEAVILDLEHGVIGQEMADVLTMTCKSIGLRVYSRVASADRVPVQHALDSGADGVILPQITCLEEAREATAYAKYPPLGTRGVGYNRTMKYDASTSRFFDEENKRSVCLPMIETAGALAEVEAILRLDTVDGVFVGPSDLSMMRGRGPFEATAEDLADFEKIASAAANVGKIWGLPAPGKKIFDFAVQHHAALVTLCDDLTALRMGLAEGLAVVGGR
jgi:2-keto-3-deoxy-L-rhamnonate aldolase RhmA